jgi:hypothetical protein
MRVRVTDAARLCPALNGRANVWWLGHRQPVHAAEAGPLSPLTVVTHNYEITTAASHRSTLTRSTFSNPQQAGQHAIGAPSTGARIGAHQAAGARHPQCQRLRPRIKKRIVLRRLRGDHYKTHRVRGHCVHLGAVCMRGDPSRPPPPLMKDKPRRHGTGARWSCAQARRLF